MKNGNHLFQHAAFPFPSEVISNQWSKSQLMLVCFGYGKPNRRLCSMRAEALPGVGGWESAAPGELARRLKALEKLRRTMSVSLPRVKAMLLWITDSRRWLGTLCAVCVEKRLPRTVFFFIFSLLQLHYHFALIYAPYKLICRNNFQFQCQHSFSH